ncbi:AfsR/SARP family transcriptional regulator [Yinghuangia soli]|uniref:Winged helix-turn-helix domain-containing protein n=1 Tax=Yinghuangia soli TaxID=2908204 RepID=A0AA41PV50_9ACTN|nr:BTAD domain-containing putative transcriptional regulator [Yinghuangia soli]MCF2526177.1 winged helix-turn-helix domain-containing protein [Yinghuangia soli]
MYVSVLGPLQVRDEVGEPVPVSGTRLRVLLTRMALDAGRPVPADVLVRAVWDEDEPSGAANALQSLVSRLRRMLGPEAITSGPAGYVLAVDPGAVDVHRFERAAADGRRLLADDDPAAAEARLAEALGLWRGAALADAAEAGFAAGPAARLEELRLTALEDRVDARLRLGQAAEVVPELEQLAMEHPLRERIHGRLMAALDAVGRRADALAVYQTLRTELADELGIDPSPELDAVHMAILRGEPTIATPGSVAAGSAASRAAASGPVGSGAAGSGAAGSGDETLAAAVSGAAETVRTSEPAAAPAATAAGTTTPASAADPAPDSAPAPAAAPASASAPAPATNLTARLTSFVGRDDERSRLAGMLAESRLVSVVGPGGAGKTRITVETGTALLADFPGGVWIVELAPVHDPSDIPQAILGALGRRESGILASGMVESPGGSGGRDAPRDVLARVVELLVRRPALLILDNCEHLVADIAEVADTLLAQAPTLRVLTSTREPLGIVGEALYPLGPLGLPGETADSAAALASPSVRLFADRAKAVRPGLVIDGANIGAVVEICRRLDGMPLAIELAAARTRSLTPTQIARRLDDRFKLLTGGSRTAMPRHQTLRAVVEWSWDLLDDRERAVLRRLSVFAGGATLEAAEEVLSDGELLEPDDVLDLLAGLVDKSLVDVFGTGEPRYRMLETIAAFAAERREDDGADAGIAQRHVDWAIRLLERLDPMLRTGDQLDAIGVIAEEHDNFGTALRFAIDAGDARSAVRAVSLMGWYWTIRGYHREASAWLGDALAVPHGGNPPDPESRVLAEWFHGTTLVVTGGEPDGVRWLMRSRWHMRQLAGPVTHPLVLLVESLTAALRDYVTGTMTALGAIEEHGDRWVRAVVDLIAGHVAVNGGQTDEGVRRLRRARVRFLEIGDRWGRSSAAGGLSEVYRFAGRLEEGIAAIDECLELVRVLGSDEDVPLLLARRAQAYWQLGDEEAALADMNAAIEVAGDADTAGGVVLAYAWAGDLARLRGDRPEAEKQYARAVAELPTARMVPFQMIAYLHLSLAYFAEAPHERSKAKEALDTALAAALDSRDMPVVASVAEGLAWWTFTGGDPESAAAILGAATATRGHVDLGSPDAIRVTADVKEALPEDTYTKAHDRGLALSHAEALDLFKSV